MNDLSVACRRAGAGWECTVTVGPEPGTTQHAVMVSDGTLRRLAPQSVDPTALVEASFGFLLEHETRESILRSFELPMIGHYFPEWEEAMRGRLARD